MFNFVEIFIYFSNFYPKQKLFLKNERSKFECLGPANFERLTKVEALKAPYVLPIYNSIKWLGSSNVKDMLKIGFIRPTPLPLHLQIFWFEKGGWDLLLHR